MKQKFLFLTTMLFALCVLLPSCGDEDEPTLNYEFSISEDDQSLTAPALGKSFSINVISTQNSSRTGFDIVSFPEWAPAELNLSSLTIDVSENLSREGRTGSVIIKQTESGKTIEIKITQDEVSDKATIEPLFKVNTYKIQVISPSIVGYSNAPEYKWYEVTSSGETLLTETKDLAFIRESANKYKLKFHIKDGNVEETLYTEVEVSEPSTPYSEKIAKIYEYTPAPGWRVGANGNAGSTKEMVIETIQEKMASGNFVSLGDFGGYMVFGFDHTIINKAGLRDFRITSSTGKGNNTRPGVIMVSYDANGNGEADDEWYEIAGSEYNHVQTQRGVNITYYKPTEPLENFNQGDNYLKWKTNKDEEGYITKKMSGMGADPVYPLWYRGNQEEEITFKNLTKLRSTIVMNGMFPDQSSDANYKPFEYGYACNIADKDKIGTSIDIAWAVDANGKYVDLPGIDFVKVYTGTFVERGNFYGEADTDIKNAYDLHMLGENIETITPNKSTMRQSK